METKPPTRNINWTEALLGEMLLLGLFGKIWQSYPERNGLNAFTNEELFSESPFGHEHSDVRAGLSLLRSWVEKNRTGISEDSLQELQADYTRLFIGAGKVLAPPWESVYFTEERLVFQEQTLQVRQWYRRFGLEPEKLYKEPDDHIGLEMSFVSHLAKLALQALEEQDTIKFGQLLEVQRQFLTEHLLRWGPYWCTLVSKHAHTDFYKGLALFTQGALLTLAEQFGIKTSKEVVL